MLSWAVVFFIFAIIAFLMDRGEHLRADHREHDQDINDP